MMLSSPAVHDCDLHATASLVAPNALRLQYRVQNHSALPLYLFNRFFIYMKDDNFVEVLPNMVNVQLYADRVTVGKALIPVPDDMEVEHLYVPCLSRLGPQEVFEETVELPLPLVPFTVYKHRPMKQGPVQRALHFEVGYFLASEHTERLISSVQTPQGPAHYIDSYPVEKQRLISTGPLLADVVVLSER